MTEENVNEKPNSVEISVNAKGQMSGKLKVYSEKIDDAMNEAKTKAIDLKNWMNEQSSQHETKTL